MDNAPKPVKPYLGHRENQRARILEAAERLFIRNGIDQVNLSDIARAARLTRNTVYEYFPNKQEVAWALLQKIFDQGQGSTEQPPAGNGFQRLANFMLQMVNRLESQSEHMRFIVEFNSLYAREASADRMRQATGRAEPASGDPIDRIIRQGIADGTIRPDLDPGLASAAVWNLLSGMNSRFALLGGLISEEYNRPSMAIYHEICRIFLRGVQSTPSTQENAG